MALGSFEPIGPTSQITAASKAIRKMQPISNSLNVDSGIQPEAALALIESNIVPPDRKVGHKVENHKSDQHKKDRVVGPPGLEPGTRPL